MVNGKLVVSKGHKALRTNRYGAPLGSLGYPIRHYFSLVVPLNAVAFVSGPNLRFAEIRV